MVEAEKKRLTCLYIFGKGKALNKCVYIVDDELHIRKLLEVGLAEMGFLTRTFEDGQTFLKAVAEKLPDLIVLDWMMPSPDGMELCGILRAQPRTRPIPILMLTARSGEGDRIKGLNTGADDYVTKPFSIKEISARLHALLRREEYLANKSNATVVFGDLELDEAARILRQGGEEVPLPLKEFELISMLMKNKGRVLTRELLLDTVWNGEYSVDSRTVDVHIRYLRQKLGDNKFVEIQTVRGVGYRLALTKGVE